MGTTANAIPVRLERGEPADVLIMVGYALGDLVKQGKVVADSRVDLVKSPIGIAVKSGAPKPDISSADAVKRALLAAKSVAYSDSASGVYVSTEMFDKLGIADAMKDKAQQDPGHAGRRNRGARRGRDRLPADRRTEPVAGIDIVGPLPDDLQKITVFSAGIATGSKEPEAGKALIKFLASPAARDASSRAAGADRGECDELNPAIRPPARSTQIGSGNYRLGRRPLRPLEFQDIGRREPGQRDHEDHGGNVHAHPVFEIIRSVRLKIRQIIAQLVARKIEQLANVAAGNVSAALFGKTFRVARPEADHVAFACNPCLQRVVHSSCCRSPAKSVKNFRFACSADHARA